MNLLSRDVAALSVTGPHNFDGTAGRLLTGMAEGLRRRAHEGERGEANSIKFYGSPWPRPGEGYVHVRHARLRQDKVIARNVRMTNSPMHNTVAWVDRVLKAMLLWSRPAKAGVRETSA